MIRADVQFDSRRVVLELDRLARDAVPQAAARALNRTATSVRAEAVRQVRRALPLKAKAVRARLRIFKATRNQLAVTIAATRDYDPPLSVFGPRWQQRQAVGATVQVPGRGRVAVPGAFVARTPYKRDAVFRRIGRERRPLKFLRASDVGLPTVSAAFLQAAADAGLQGKAREKFARELAHEMARGNRG